MQSLKLEKRLIKKIGLKCKKNGPLTNVMYSSGRGGGVRLGFDNPNKNIPGKINMTNIKKSISLKQTWAAGRFKRKQTIYSLQLRLKMSANRKASWTSVAKQALSEKNKKEWQLGVRIGRPRYVWIVSSPTGEELIIKNLVAFCTEKVNFNYNTMHLYMSKGKSYKGYTPKSVIPVAEYYSSTLSLSIPSTASQE